MQNLLYPAQANLGYFLAWFQSLQLSGTWHHVGLLQTDVLEERFASVFRVEEIRRARRSVRQLGSDHLTLFLARIISLTLKMEATVPPKLRFIIHTVPHPRRLISSEFFVFYSDYLTCY
jgi:hypothetical protein